MRPSTPRLAVKPESGAQPVDQPLDSRATAIACGKVRKLDEDAFVKLDLITRLGQLMRPSGFSDEEIKDPSNSLQDEAFEAYALGYLTWDKSKEVSRADLDKMAINAFGSVDQGKLSLAEREQLDVFLVKFKRMMLRAFDLGRHAAKTLPCPF